MNVLLLGATGLVGRALSLRLARDGHRVTAWVRDVAAARSLLGADVELVDAAEGDEGLRVALSRCDGVVNLAGAPIGRRWTARVRRDAVTSRVDLGRRIARVIGESNPRPRVLVAASAVGIYGDRGDEVLDESATVADGWLARLVRDWEAAGREAEAHGVRVATIRIGVVLATDGGALAALLPTARLGLGAVLGSGRQYMPWIELHDLVELLVTALVDDRWDGVFNASAPTPVTNRELTDSIARALRRPRIFFAPGFALQLALGEAAQIVLHGQRVLPRRAESLGFRFRHRELGSALAELLDGRAPPTIARAEGWPRTPYLDERAPRFKLETRIRLAQPHARVLDFYSRPANLGALTPGNMRFTMLDTPPELVRPGLELAQRVYFGPIGLRWLSRIDRLDERGFADSQLRGPFAVWHHEHEILPDGDGTLLVDRVWYAVPFGPFGALAHPLWVAPQLRELFRHRTRCAVLRFGDAEAQPAE